MAKNKCTLEFDGFDRLKKQLDYIGGEATKRAVNNALKESEKYIAEQVTQAMRKHNDTGETTRSIISDDNVQWAADLASIAVGFDINKGGLASIFLMYGTKLHGQPHIEPDRKLYNAVYGTKTRKKIRELQETEFKKVLEQAVRQR